MGHRRYWGHRGHEGHRKYWGHRGHRRYCSGGTVHCTEVETCLTGLTGHRGHRETECNSFKT